MKKKRGFAALLIIFILGMVSILVASGLILTGYNESQMARSGAFGTSAYYVANAGVEDAIYKLNALANYAATNTEAYEFHVGSEKVSVTVAPTADPKTRTIDAEGTQGSYVSRIHATVKLTSVTPKFLYGMQSGVNGIEIAQNTDIKAQTGNLVIYSNGYIAGEVNKQQGSSCHNESSGVFGSAYAVTSFDRTTILGNGVCITEDALASVYNYCYIFGNRRIAASGNCLGGTVPSPIPSTPTPVPLPDMDLTVMTDYLTAHGQIFGSCTVDGSSACSGGAAKTIGNEIIVGNLTIPPNTTMTVTGPVWVQGQINVESNVVINLTGPKGKIVLADDTITLKNNISSTPIGNAYLLFVSSYTLYPSPSPTPTPGPSSHFCDTAAINIGPATTNILFYALNGCLAITNNATFIGAVVGEKITVSNNSHIKYDSNLINAAFDVTQGGGWQIASFKQD